MDLQLFTWTGTTGIPFSGCGPWDLLVLWLMICGTGFLAYFVWTDDTV